MSANYKIGCVVVLYNPDEKVADHVKGYPTSINEILLVDNSDNNNVKIFESILGERIHYLPLNKNTGIAHAMNVGIKKLRENNDYIITMDQDSSIIHDIISVYINYLDNNSGDYALTPKFNTDRNPSVASLGTEIVELSMQSGTLFPVRLFDRIGYFDEDMFLDVTDWEFFLRMKKNGIPLIRCNEAVLNHQPAITHSKKIFGRELKYGTASPVRYYYQSRNLLWTARKYHSISMYKTLLIKWLKIELLFDDKNSYRVAFKRGIHDAKVQHLGAYK